MVSKKAFQLLRNSSLSMSFSIYF